MSLRRFFSPLRIRFWLVTLPAVFVIGVAATMCTLHSNPDYESRDIWLGFWKIGRIEAREIRWSQGGVPGHLERYRSLRLGPFECSALFGTNPLNDLYPERFKGIHSGWRNGPAEQPGFSLGTDHWLVVVSIHSGQ